MGLKCALESVNNLAALYKNLKNIVTTRTQLGGGDLMCSIGEGGAGAVWQSVYSESEVAQRAVC